MEHAVHGLTSMTSSNQSPFNVILPGWVGSAVPWSLIVSNPIDLTTLAAWDPAVTYTGTSPASIVLYQSAAWQAVAPVLAEAPGTVAGHWIPVTSTPIDVSGWTVMFTVKNSYLDPDSSAIYIHDFLMPSGSANGVIGDELPDLYTQLIKGGSTLLFDVRVVTLTSPEPQMMMAGTIPIANTVGRRIVPNFTTPVWTPPA